MIISIKGNGMLELIIFTITSRCNARCKMCYMWQRNEKDIPFDKITQVLNSKVVKNSLINLVPTGGEPTLREDLPEIFHYAFQNLTKLKYTGFFTNSLIPQKTHDIVRKVMPLKDKLNRSDVSFSVALSLDGFGETHDNIRGIKGAFGKTMENYLRLKALTKKYKFYTGFNFVVQKENIVSGDALFMLDVAERALLPILFPIVYGKDIFYNRENINEWNIEKELLRDVVGFYKELIKRTREGRLLVDNGTYYNQILSQLQGEARTLPCLFKENKACVIDADGSVYLCDLTKGSLIGNIHEKNFDEIWNSPEKDTAYQKMITYCNRCFSNCAIASGRYQIRAIWNSKGIRGLAALSYKELYKRLSRLIRLIDEYKYAFWPRL